MESNLITVRIRESEKRLKRIALELFEKCKSENLTIWEFNRTLEFLKDNVDIKVTLNGQQEIL